jgi:hypothetical protein
MRQPLTPPPWSAHRGSRRLRQNARNVRVRRGCSGCNIGVDARRPASRPRPHPCCVQLRGGFGDSARPGGWLLGGVVCRCVLRESFVRKRVRRGLERGLSTVSRALRAGPDVGTAGLRRVAVPGPMPRCIPSLESRWIPPVNAGAVNPHAPGVAQLPRCPRQHDIERGVLLLSVLGVSG